MNIRGEPLTITRVDFSINEMGRVYEKNVDYFKTPGDTPTDIRTEYEYVPLPEITVN